MKMRNYLKRCRGHNEERGLNLLAATLQVVFKKRLLLGISGVTLLVLAAVLGLKQNIDSVSISDESGVAFSSAPMTAVSTKKSVIVIPSGTVKANPFLPYRDIDNSGPDLDVPAYTLVDPPEVLSESSDAARVMDTIVSGILYDKFSPSAILNIEGNDYLVKKGDVVNNYKVLSIVEDSVTVKLGENVYKAGIGQILTEGSLNYNEVSNLSNKFGGENNELQ